MKNLIIILLGLFLTTTAYSQHFETGSHIATAELKKELASFYNKKIKGKKIYSLEIEGHTDVRGSASYNSALSKRRAETALNELRKLGFKGDYVITKGLGETNPISKIHGENRRIVLRVKSSTGNSVTVIKECKSDIRVIVKKEKAEPKRNRIRVLGGKGPTGVSLKKKGNKTTLSEEDGLVLGLGYDRLVGEKISIGAQIQTNETLLLNLGLDF